MLSTLRSATLTTIAALLVLPGMFGCGSEPPPDTGDQNQNQNNQQANHNQNGDNQENDDNQQDNEDQLDEYDPAAEDRETALEINVTNGANTSFYFQMATDEQPEPVWLTLFVDGQPLTINPECMPRLCGEDKKPVCDEQRQPEAVEIPPSKEITYEWDGYHYTTHDGCTVVDRIEDREMELEMCWGMDVDDEGRIQDRDCDTHDGFNPAETPALNATVS